MYGTIDVDDRLKISSPPLCRCRLDIKDASWIVPSQLPKLPAIRTLTVSCRPRTLAQDGLFTAEELLSVRRMIDKPIVVNRSSSRCGREDLRRFLQERTLWCRDQPGMLVQ